MGPYVAALLLFGVIVNIAECDNDHDSCHRGLSVFETFVNQPCGVDNDPLVTLLQSPELTAGPLTADKVRHVVTQFCSTVMPAVRRCFAERVSHCEDRQQRYLNGVANDTGFLCTPGSSEVQPWVITVLSRLTDSDLKENKSCSEKRAIHNFCLQRATRAASQSASVNPNAMNRLPVREFLPLVRSFFTTLFGCLVRKHLRDPFRCSGWRWHAFNAFLDFRHMGVTPLGFHVALTPDQARFMFEL